MQNLNNVMNAGNIRKEERRWVNRCSDFFRKFIHFGEDSVPYLDSNTLFVLQNYGHLESEWDSAQMATEMLRKFQLFANKVITTSRTAQVAGNLPKLT